MEQLTKSFKAILLFVALTIGVFLVSYPVIAYNMFYPEQALIYLANQSIHHWQDLLNVYLHPMLFHVAIPFFRPSGHFLLYQLITPFFGWHNNQIFIMVNLIFLAASGICIIKLYQRLFPSLYIGGYIAFAIYLMHPALSLSRLIILHFEFAYIFFSTLCFYFFVQFLDSNRKVLIAPQSIQRATNQLFQLRLLAYAILFYFIAITFKEAALIQGVLLFIYLFFFIYQPGTLNPWQELSKNILARKEIPQLFAFLLVVILTFCAYLSMSWQTPLHPSLKAVDGHLVYLGIKQYLKLLFGLGNYQQFYVDPDTGVWWREVIFPFYTRAILSIFLVMSLLCAYFLFAPSNSNDNPLYKKNYLFLSIAILICAIIPIRWALVFPWHLSHSLIFMSLLFGFSLEFILKHKQSILSLASQHALLVLIALIIAVSGFGVNQVNVNRYQLDKQLNFGLNLNRNAILNPPKLNKPIDENTLLVTVDNQLGLSYMFGAGQYPLQFLDFSNRDFFVKRNRYLFLPTPAKKGGHLFKWAYLNPLLQEELIPMTTTSIEKIPNEYIYEWMKHDSNIVFLTYDENANWHNSTARYRVLVHRIFKEKHIHLNAYHQFAITAFSHPFYVAIDLPVADVNLCEYKCSQDAICSGFNYINVRVGDYVRYQCQLMSDADLKNKKTCIFCSAYVKNKQVV